ncbi:30S ribosomal protein S19 [Candidatus Pacearchaeota archaeon]|nr:30S ribosomal protein S19 [Candidatus Pacearchaeota archaeon]|tara:strand:+ start:7677 stop:8084 length:408 start_codon:yes stop_codon:yes gene_type:complete
MVKEKVQIKTKELIYRGQPLEELQKMDVRESAKFLPSRSRRTILRNFDVIEKFIARAEKKDIKKKRIKTHLRDLVVVPRLVGLTISVHNGKSFTEVPITIEMIGHRLGEFAQTRGKVNHGSAGIGATKSSRAQKK